MLRSESSDKRRVVASHLDFAHESAPAAMPPWAGAVRTDLVADDAQRISRSTISVDWIDTFSPSLKARTA